MSVECLFVPGLNCIERRLLAQSDASLPVHRIPRPLSVFTGGFDGPDTFDPAAITMTVDTFTRQGRMFDGRLIFVAEGFEVRKLHVRLAITTRELHAESPSYLEKVLINNLEREAVHLMERDYGQWRTIDRQLTERRIEAAQLTEYELRLLVAVLKTKEPPERENYEYLHSGVAKAIRGYKSKPALPPFRRRSKPNGTIY